MRIVEWGSDVCASDLIPRPARSQRAGISKLCRKAGEFAHSLAVTVIQDSQPARCVLGCAASTPILLTRVGALVASVSAWNADMRSDIRAALEEDLREAGVEPDPFGARTHAATVSDRKSTRLNSSHSCAYRLPSSA